MLNLQGNPQSWVTVNLKFLFGYSGFLLTLISSPMKVECFPNHSHFEVLQSVFLGDWTYINFFLIPKLLRNPKLFTQTWLVSSLLYFDLIFFQLGNRAWPCVYPADSWLTNKMADLFASVAITEAFIKIPDKAAVF